MTRKDLIKTILTPFASVIVILGSLLLVILRPVSELIVRKILADTDPQQFFQMTAAEVDDAMKGESRENGRSSWR